MKFWQNLDNRRYENLSSCDNFIKIFSLRTKLQFYDKVQHLLQQFKHNGFEI